MTTQTDTMFVIKFDGLKRNGAQYSAWYTADNTRVAKGWDSPTRLCTYLVATHGISYDDISIEVDDDN